MSFTAPTVTGYSGFYSSSVGIASSGNEASYNAVSRAARSSTEMQVARALARPGFRGMRRVLLVLTGAAAGSAASETHKRVVAPTPFNIATGGGLRTIETVTDSTGNTTAGQETYIETNMINARYAANPSSYATDLSANGGGGKLGR